MIRRLRCPCVGFSPATLSAQRLSKGGTCSERRLLNAAEAAGFDVLLTTDRNMGYQQNLATRTIAVLVLNKQQWPQPRSHVDTVKAVIDSVVAGSFIEVQLEDS